MTKSHFAGYKFNAPYPYKEDNFAQRVDYKMTDKVSFEGVGRFTKTNGNGISGPVPPR